MSTTVLVPPAKQVLLVYGDGHASYFQAVPGGDLLIGNSGRPITCVEIMGFVEPLGMPALDPRHARKKASWRMRPNATWGTGEQFKIRVCSVEGFEAARARVQQLVAVVMRDLAAFDLD